MTSDGKFEPGDVVVLKSRQGPRMTVESLSEDGKLVDACWFDEAGHLHRQPIATFALRLVKNP